MALKKQQFAEGEIAIFDEACIYKRGEYWQFRMWLPKENKYAVTDWHSEALCKYFCHNPTRFNKRRKKCFSTDELTYNIRVTHNQRRCEMKSYDELKAEMETIRSRWLRLRRMNELTH